MVCQVRFQPKDPSVIVSVGKEHLVFWNLDKEGGRLAEKIKPNYEVSLLFCSLIQSQVWILGEDDGGRMGWGGGVGRGGHVHIHPFHTVQKYTLA